MDASHTTLSLFPIIVVNNIYYLVTVAIQQCDSRCRSVVIHSVFRVLFILVY